MKNHTAFIFIILILFFTSCKDIVETDLSDKNVAILSPVNNSVSASFSQTFWWQEIDGAITYKLQIVKPNFSSIQELTIDTTIATTQFSFTLSPGTYQWRVKAMNGSSDTDYSVYNLTIDSTLDLSNQWVLLNSPVDKDSSSQATHLFSWQTLSNTDSYLFQIVMNGLPIYTQTLTTTTSINYTFLNDGTYQWRVFAQNATSTSSPVNATRTITIDRVAPNTPVLSSPIANDSVSNPVNLSWVSDPTYSYDSVYVYADTNLTVLVASGISTNQTYNYTGTVGQDYFWRVRSIDAVGNKSIYSNRRKFIIAP
ncbi:MAG: hypothetical protein WBM13_11160 [Bacteroidia bacterium]